MTGHSPLNDDAPRFPPVREDQLGQALAAFQSALQTPLDGAGVRMRVEEASDLLVGEVERWNLDFDQRNSLILRVLAFNELLGRAAHDDRFAAHVEAVGGAYNVSDDFMRAAARAELAPSGPDQEGLAFNLESVLGGLRR